VHHRVKNNLQVIASLLRMQANACPDDASGLALRESQHRVEAMALIHEQLYQTEDLRNVDLAAHAELLVSSLFDSYGVDPSRITHSVSIEPVMLGVDRAITTGLVLNELISNALKHGFPNGRAGSITISGGRQEGNVVLTVSDDGVGVPDEAKLIHSKSIGLEIVRILSRQLKGKCELDRSQGTTFRFSFPERQSRT
jgi:two-component sensor histidine kinase